MVSRKTQQHTTNKFQKFDKKIQALCGLRRFFLYLTVKLPCRFHSLSISASPMFFAGKSAYDGLEELHVWKIWERKAGAWKRGKYEGRKRKEEVEIEGWEACV